MAMRKIRYQKAVLVTVDKEGLLTTLMKAGTNIYRRLVKCVHMIWVFAVVTQLPIYKLCNIE